MTEVRPGDEALTRLDALVRGVRLRVRAWVWAEEGIRGLAVALGGATVVALVAKLAPVSPLAWLVPIAAGASIAVRGALARRFGAPEAALLLDRVSEAEGEVFTAFEKRNAWLGARAAARAAKCRIPLIPRGVPRTLWPAAVLAGVLAATPLLPEGQAVAMPRTREAQAERIERAVILAATDKDIEGRLRALAREVRGGEASRVSAAVGELSDAVDAARRRAEAADIVARSTGGASDSREAAERAVAAPGALQEALLGAAGRFPEGEAPEELTDAQRALEQGDVEALAAAIERILDPARRLDTDTAARLQARVEAIRAELGGTSASADSKGAAGSAGTGKASLLAGAEEASAPTPSASAPLDVAGRLREEALKRPTWPSELDPVVRDYFGGTAEVER
ncbi:MAG: hypothetical protein AAB434_00225 [Planctomycetota bacterium]